MSPSHRTRAVAVAGRVDAQRPDAPHLAAYGSHDVGVTTVAWTDAGRIDAADAAPDRPFAVTDRTLTVEVWYPATPSAIETREAAYDVLLRDGVTRALLAGRARRDAPPARDAGPYPLVVVSHGYPGNRFLMAHLSENLASKGYVVAAIDHAESTYDDLGAFAGTLYHRPLDQRFVVDMMERASHRTDGPFAGLVDASRSAIVGYSMGGYGAVNLIGGGLSAVATDHSWAPAHRLLAQHQAGDASFEARRDPRIKAAVAFAPWGMQVGLWDAAGLEGITTPTLFVAGSHDDISGYADGVRALYEGAVNADRWLLTFQHAGHSVAAPIPAPHTAWGEHFGHYADPVWDTVRMNNVAQHFVTAFVRRWLDDDVAMDAYLDLVPHAADGVWAVDDAGAFTDRHTYWKGFPERTAHGLTLEHLPPRAR